ncbi:MAG: class I SAM-dependent methyltransferase [Hyphomicrobiales bacterium]|nr:class I SAM-dependent methyltransferase [Hyphomicrobiales bacterium]
MPVRDVEAYEYTLERTRSYLAKTGRVLELGCGTGSTALLLAGITGNDISPNMIGIARAPGHAISASSTKNGSTGTVLMTRAEIGAIVA